eukprot:2582802-Pleurochrysis_carterae.AAC.2
MVCPSMRCLTPSHSCAHPSCPARDCRSGCAFSPIARVLLPRQAGDNVGCLLRGLKRDDVCRGQARARRRSSALRSAASRPSQREAARPLE